LASPRIMVSATFSLFSLLLLLLLESGQGNAATPRERAEALLAQMTLNEKLSMVRGYSGHPYVGFVEAVPRLNIPALTLEDGPQGVADGVHNVTCWPSALTIVASWDVDGMYEFAAAVALEERRKGANIWLGPMVNIARVPWGGRNFESFGEDPYLAAEMARFNVRGAQSQGVMATVKHWANNNQEYNRSTTSANLPDDRTQWEIYYPAFKAAIEAGVASVMCSYNRINGTWACENERTLNEDLKLTMKFDGFVMSDWGATHTTVKAANAGLDMQMPDDSFFGAPLAKAISSGQVPLSRLDDMVVRILTSMYKVGIMDNPQTGNITDDVRSPEHSQLARKLSAESTVLLKNAHNTLPLVASKLRTIAVIGDCGNDQPIYAGGGSGYVIAESVVTPLQGIKHYLERRGLRQIEVLYANSSDIANAMVLANKADVALVFVGTNSGEGSDRRDLSLNGDSDDLVQGVVKANPNTVVVLHIPGAVLMPWIDAVPAVLSPLMPGQESGHAIASVLFGEVNPSAKLPITFPKTETQTYLKTPREYPGVDNEGSYSEKLLVGYRWYDAVNEKPLFPFGHGLSYTTFKYANLRVLHRVISVELTNTGPVEGAEVVQVYLQYPHTAGEPPKQLRGFEKVLLVPGQTETLAFTLRDEDLSIWDQNAHQWAIVRGVFSVHVGSSSRDIRLSAFLHVA